MAGGLERHRFSVDIPGLLEALTEQFPEPLLCVRELIQNAADAGAARIEVDVSYDASRSLFRLSVRDDGRGMNASEVESYLTIGFSEKDPAKDRGRFGVGKLSPYALGITRMVVETCDGQVAHRLTFNGDGEGTIARVALRPKGTVVRVYKATGRADAEALAERCFHLVQDRCGSLAIPLYVNGHPVNREISLPTPYALPFTGSEGEGKGVLGIVAEPLRVLMGGGIVLETDAQILGPEISYILDSPRLSPTLSRNAVRRDGAFEALLRVARAHQQALTAHVVRELRSRVDRLRQEGKPVERGLDPNDRSAVEWLRSQLLEPEDQAPDSVIKSAPVLETADGGLVSADDLIEVIQKEQRLPISRVPRTRDEIAAYADRGVPVLLLYRDLEDFLERREIPTVEADGRDDGPEVSPGQWSRGEAALALRPQLGKRRPPRRAFGLVAAGVAAAAALAVVVIGADWLSVPDEDAAPEIVAIAPAKPAPAATVAIPAPSEAATPGPASPIAGGLDPTPQAPEPSSAMITGVPKSGPKAMRPLLVTIAAIVAALSAAAGFAMLYQTFRPRPPPRASWLKPDPAAPLTVGEGRRRRFDVLRRAALHPIDFFVARGWSIRAAGNRSLSGSNAIRGYRELAPEAPIRSGVRLDLDRVEIGFVDLVSAVGEPHDGRILLARGHRVLLNRNHPTVRDLIKIAEVEPKRARVLLDVLLATDPDLARGTDPRQVEWDLLGRAEQGLRAGSGS